MTWRRRTLGIATLLAGAACGRGRTTAQDSSSGAPGAAGTLARSGALPALACPRTGHWSACQVKLRLEQAGLAPHTGDKLDDLPAAGPAPTVYMVGTAPLAIYLFPDAEARARAGRALDTTKFVPPAQALSTRGEATAIQNDNLLGILFSRRDQQRERVSDALSAGPPQP